MMIRAIIFDLFGTLTSAPWSNFIDSINRMASALGIDREEFFNTWMEQTYKRRNTGGFNSIYEEMLWICDHHGIVPTGESLTEAVGIRYNFTRSILRPRPDAVSTLNTLRSIGVLTGIISDCSVEVPELWPGTQFVGLFDTEIFSCAVGIKKPDREIFRLACEQLGVLPSECYYIGDGFSGELNGARAYGMRPFLILAPNEERPQFKSWEGNNWNGEVISSLSMIVEILTGEPNKATAPDAKRRAAD